MTEPSAGQAPSSPIAPAATQAPVLGTVPARIKTEPTREARAKAIDDTFKQMEEVAKVEIVDSALPGDAATVDAATATADATPPENTTSDTAPGDDVDKFIKAQSRIFAEREKARNVLSEAMQAQQQLQSLAQRIDHDRKQIETAKDSLRKLEQLAKTDRKKFAELMGFDTKQMLADFASGRTDQLPMQDEYKNTINSALREFKQEIAAERAAIRAERQQEQQKYQLAQLQAQKQKVESDWIQTGSDSAKYPILARMSPAQRLKFGNDAADDLRAAGNTNFTLHDVAKHVESSLKRLLSGDTSAPASDQRERQAREKPTPSMAALTSRGTAEAATPSIGNRSREERLAAARREFDAMGGVFHED